MKIIKNKMMRETRLFREKIKTADELFSLAEGWREAGRKIVFTGGWFDPFHVSHVRHMRKSRPLGDVLVVGIFSDDSLSGRAGDAVPLVDQNGRCMIVAAIGCVDFVTTITVDEVDKFFTALKPDIYTVGSESATAPEAIAALQEEVAAMKAASYGAKLVATGVEVPSIQELYSMIEARTKP